ncbi:MAG: sigma-70 family RNA polymerase sigma factor [Chitinophagaceae bacterium]|jgi:RNA polymerase sigma factor (sigma-70 family)|nr:sigma-70 family RNA polymerase sigma factor [Chitinophagaceae bacterium]
MHFSNLSDAELVLAYQQGQEQALSTLITRHKDAVYTSLFMLVKDKYLAEDLFQDTFLKIIKTIKEGRYSEQGKFLPWAVRVARNLCMDYFRRTRLQISVTLPDGQDISALLGTAELASDAIERRQVHDSVRKLVEGLPEEQREVIVLRMYADLSFKEISELTGVSINTALGRMRYALINMRKLIADKQLVLR